MIYFEYTWYILLFILFALKINYFYLLNINSCKNNNNIINKLK